ncbi:cholecystokinin receptor type A-like [Tachypleus tridentatus]|uniref:cholecystokinin receptor type A-like n=1 Tax=Tachypleus tridentatus TaxID=6853 RepID=UPI003FD58361
MSDLFRYLLKINSTILEANNFSKDEWLLIEGELGISMLENNTEKNSSHNHFQPKHPVSFSFDFIWTTAVITRVCLYSVIFIFAVLGNALVITILTHNKRMRNVTNTFLLNLAISDILLGVFCMPFTLVGSLLRNFIFGNFMCRLIPYLQAVSVSVSVWTLVSISIERYYAICRPLVSRQWQTISHAYQVIFFIWGGSLMMMLPVAVLSQLIPTNTPGKLKCREVWPNNYMERGFNLFLDVLLLIVPVLTMSVTYFCIIRTLQKETNNVTSSEPGIPTRKRENTGSDNFSSTSFQMLWRKRPIYRRTGEPTCSNQHTAAHPLIIRGNTAKSQVAKRRVIQMLFVLVLEFIVCWTPLYVLNTWVLYDHEGLYSSVGPTGISVIHLLAYCSSCCNPITYCFMYNKFRKAFLSFFGFQKKKTWQSNLGSDLPTVNSIFSARNTTRLEIFGRIEDMRL